MKKEKERGLIGGFCRPSEMVRELHQVLHAFQEEVGEWGNKEFPFGTQRSIVEHLKLEVNELADLHEPEEAADCFLLLLHHAYRGGYSLINEAIKKFEINKQRIWGKPDAAGIVGHVQDPREGD